MSSFTPGSDRHENEAAQDRELRVWALTRVGVSREKAEAQVDDVLARGLVAPLTSDERARLQRARQEAESNG